jgi:hypothetical protein
MFDGIKKKISGIKQKGQVAAAKKMMEKQGVAGPQQEMLLALMEKNPVLFEKIGKEIEQLKKEGKGEMAASMQVMRKYQGEIQRLMARR